MNQGKRFKLFNFYRRPVGAYCIRPHNKISQPGVFNTPLQEAENSFMNFEAFALVMNCYHYNTTCLFVSCRLKNIFYKITTNY